MTAGRLVFYKFAVSRCRRKFIAKVGVRDGNQCLGTLVNAWLAGGGSAVGVKSGTAYVDVGTLHGWREALALLSEGPSENSPISFPAARAAASATGVIR